MPGDSNLSIYPWADYEQWNQTTTGRSLPKTWLEAPNFWFCSIVTGIETFSLYCRQSWNWRSTCLFIYQLLLKLNVCKPDTTYCVCLVDRNLQPHGYWLINPNGNNLPFPIHCSIFTSFKIHTCQTYALDPTEVKPLPTNLPSVLKMEHGFNSQNVSYSWSLFYE